MNTPQKTALVTGANRGLGHGCAQALLDQGFFVIATGREMAKLQEVARTHAWPEGRFRLLELDTSSEASLLSFEKQVASLGRLDVVINNAGVYLDPRERSLLGIAPADLLKTLMTNVYGPFRVCQAVLPGMRKTGSGRIVNVSSGMGQLSEMGAGAEAYRVSKTALNGLTATLAAALKGTDILVNSVCPGWVRTDMGGAGASRELKQGVDSILHAATLPVGGPNGGYFRDGKSLSW